MAPPLIDPPGRQGPGRVAGPAVAALELGLARRGGGLLPGAYRAAGLGVGTELAQLRPYVEGDDVRHLDASATARTGEPHVRVHVPERTLTTWVVLDVSASMAFGTADRLKSDVAAGAVGLLTRLAVRHGGRVALLRFGGPEASLLPPRGGRPGIGAVRRALEEGVAADRVRPAEDLATALGRLRRLARRPGLVALVSDLRDGGSWERQLAALGRDHPVVVVEVGDPRERELPDAGTIVVVDPETGHDVEVDTSSARLRAAYAEAESDRSARVAAALRRARARHVPVSTSGDWVRAVARGLT